MESHSDYDFASFGPDVDLYEKRSGSTASDASAYFKQPSYFSMTQLTDLMSASSKNTSGNSQNAALEKPPAAGGPDLINGGNTAAAAAKTLTSPPAPPAHAAPPSAGTKGAAAQANGSHSRASSGVASSCVESVDSIARLGRHFLAEDRPSPTAASSSLAMSGSSSRQSLAATAVPPPPERGGGSTWLGSPDGSAPPLFSMPTVRPALPHSTDPHHRHHHHGAQRPSHGSSSPQLLPLLKGSDGGVAEGLKHHRHSAPQRAPPHEREFTATAAASSTSDTANGHDSGSRNGAAQHLQPFFAAVSPPAANRSYTAINEKGRESAEQPTAPRRPAEAAGSRSRPRLTPAALQSAADTAAHGPAGAPFARMDGAGSPAAPAYLPNAAATEGEDEAAAGTVEAEYHVQIIIAKATSNSQPVERRPPPLDAREDYETTPLLCPLAPSAAQTFESSRSARHSSMSMSRSDTRDTFTADEVVDVGYSSGAAVRTSLIADSLRVHFLSGHNAMLTIANTPQCCALAEDAVSTMVQVLFAQSDSMGSEFRNDITISAHAVYPEGVLHNLLPTSTEPQRKTEIRLGAHPVMGTCIINDAPVNVRSADEATFLSRALVQNARRLRADPYSDPSALVHVTVQLRQTRASTRSTPAEAGERGHPPAGRRAVAEVRASDRDVYLSSLQILWVGHNYPVVHHLLTEQPPHLWPLYRQAFGGQCCTAVMAFVDHRDDLAYSKSTLEFSEYMRGFVNRPPRSGSVKKFVLSTEKAAREELDRNILSLEKMRCDAVQLLRDPQAEPCLYAVSPRNEVSHEPHIGAYRVVLIPSDDPTSPERMRSAAEGSSNNNNSNSHRSSVSKGDGDHNNSSSSRSSRRASATPRHATAPQRTSTPPLPQQQQQEEATAMERSMPSSIAEGEVTINMPPHMKEQEKSITNTLTTPPLLVSQTQLPRALERAAPPPTSSPAAESRRTPTEYSDDSTHARIRSDRQRGHHRPQAQSSSSSSTQQQQHQPRQLGSSNKNNNGAADTTTTTTATAAPAAAEEGSSTLSGYGECIKTNVLLFPGVLESPSRSNTPLPVETATSHPLPLTAPDHRTLVLAPPKATAQHFQVDDVREAHLDPSTHTFHLLRDFGALREAHTAFVEEESNVALLCTHASGVVRPFQRLPVWEVVQNTLSSVAETQSRLPTPSQFTIFGALLKGTVIVRDLAEVGSQEADRPVDGAEALVGASPIFGAILYQTRGVDLFHVSEVQPVLHSMLAYADAEAGADPDVYMVLTAVRKTTRPLPPEEAPDGSPDHTWDASFSSCVVIVTRSSMDLFQNAVAEMDSAVSPTKPRFPFGLLTEVVGGSCKTVHLLSVEMANTPLPVAARLLETQALLGQVQNEARRSNRISVYVRACLTAARALRSIMEQLRDSEAATAATLQDLSEDDARIAEAHAVKLEALAEQHLEYLRNAETRGFVIYPTPTIEDVQMLFTNSFRRSDNSSGRLKQLQARSSARPSGNALQSRATATPPQKQQQQQKGQQQQPPSPSIQRQGKAKKSEGEGKDSEKKPKTGEGLLASVSGSELRTVNASEDCISSTLDATGDTVTGVANKPLSAAAPSRDSGIVPHTLLLHLTESAQDSNEDENGKRSSKNAPAAGAPAASSPPAHDGRKPCAITTSETNEVTVDYGERTSVYAFDEVVRLSAGPDAVRVSPSRSSAVFGASATLHDAVSGCLAGYNAAIVLQETRLAQERGVGESLCQYVCRSAVGSCPPEAAFFLSVCYVDDDGAVDLGNREAVQLAVRVPGAAGRASPTLGKSPLTGIFIANGALRVVRGPRDVAESLARAFRADDHISAAAKAPPHFVVVSLWQKLYESGELDVCLSSLLIVLTRGGPGVLKDTLARSHATPMNQLLRYALRGPCYTICGCAVTDKEPQAASTAHRRDRELERAMHFYQTSLNAYTGRPLRYNSVSDALKSHRAELATVSAKLQEQRRRRLSREGPALSDEEQREAQLTEAGAQQLRRMISDEEQLLDQGMTMLEALPPFYTAHTKADSPSGNVSPSHKKKRT